MVEHFASTRQRYQNIGANGTHVDAYSANDNGFWFYYVFYGGSFSPYALTYFDPPNS